MRISASAKASVAPRLAGWRSIALHLDRPAVDRNGHDAATIAAESQRGRETQRLARDKTLRHPDVRNDFLLRLAAGSERECHLRGKHLQRVAPGEGARATCRRRDLIDERYRWHFEQSVKCLVSMWYSRMRRSPSEI